MHAINKEMLRSLMGNALFADTEEFSLAAALRVVLGAWRFLLAAGILGIVLALGFLAIRQPVFTASLYVVPLDDNSSANVRGLQSLLGTTTEKTSPFLEYRFALTSPAVAAQLAQDSYVTDYLFKGRWDVKNKVWRPPTSLVSNVVQGIKSAVGYPRWEETTAVHVAQYLDQHIVISNDIQTSVQRISINDHDRAFALYLLKAVHTNAVRNLQNKMLAITAQKISYLENKLPTVTSIEYRQALVALLAEQQKIFLTQREGMPYAAQILDGPTAPVTPTSKSPAFVLLIGWFIGLMAAIPVVFLLARRDA